MPRAKTLNEAYDSCVAEGFIRELDGINIDRIKSLIENANTNLNSAKILIEQIGKNAQEWMSVYLLHYEAIRTISEALLFFHKIKSSNHQCLFACLLMKHPNLELDWNFFEKIRTKRNSANYYGEKILYKDWKEIEIQIRLYISTLQKELGNKLI